MAVNLIDQFGRARAREILESSFAQFQADRAVVGLARQVREQEESLAGYEKAMTCDRGDFTEYSAIRRDLSDAREAQPQGRERLPRRRARRGSARSPTCAGGCSGIRAINAPTASITPAGRSGTGSSSAPCEKLRQQIETRTGTVARIFDRVVDVLVELDYVQVADDGATALTPAGRTMRRIYGERDLLVAESLRTGICGTNWMPHPSPRWRAASSTSRAGTRPARGSAGCRAGPFRTALQRDAGSLAAVSTTSSSDHRLPGTEPISAGLAQAMHSWARGDAARPRARRGRHGRGRLRALGEADDRPARPALDRRRVRRSPRPRARPSTPSGAASSPTRSV